MELRLRQAFAEAMAWERHLYINELVYGSAYGPWPPPKPLIGLSVLIDKFDKP